MSPAGLLTVYCLLIVVVSVVGGWIPRLVRLTHRRLEVALSFVSGVMLGIALLHLLPHAIVERGAWLEVAAHAPDAGVDHDHAHGVVSHELIDPVVLWVVAGFLAMFVLERWFCFHHHEPIAGEGEAGRHDHGDDHGHDHGHDHRLTWVGTTVGMTVHTLIAGAALAASVLSAETAGDERLLAGLGTFLVIVLHKPFDAITIGTLIVAGGSTRRTHMVVNALFGLAIPAGAALFVLGAQTDVDTPHRLMSAALAFSAGAFMCIALSDLLPELQFHRHDRVKLTVALLAGLAVAWATGG
jgi:zinc and cadmium transporter